MSVDDKEIEPTTDLEAALGFSNHYIRRILSNDAGAGANAGSSLDMAFVATDTLSELVWSPQNGLSLRCADGSFSEKKSSLPWGVGQGNVVSGSRTDMTVNEEKIATGSASSNAKNQVSERENSSRFLTTEVCIMPLGGSRHELTTALSSRVEEAKDTADASFLQEMKNLDSKKVEDESKLDVAKHDSVDGQGTAMDQDFGDKNQASRMEFILTSEVKTMKECWIYDNKKQNIVSSGKALEESTSLKEKERGNNMDSGPLDAYPLEKLESTAENDVRTLVGENVLPTKMLASESGHEVENNYPLGSLGLHRDETVASKQSPTNSRVQKYQMKGKAKALSEGNANKRMLNEDDDSHESAESCNSAGLFSTGKKRWNMEQQFIAGSKRAKMQIQESPGSSSIIKQDSSFMNWISNMMKGFLKSNEDETPSLALTIANPSHRHESSDKKLTASNRSQEHGNTGFQSIFQSLYCPKTKTQDAVNPHSNYQIEGSTELEAGNKICNFSATPIACRAMTGGIYKHVVQSNEKFTEPKSGNGDGKVAHPTDLSVNPSGSEEINWIIPADKKKVCNLATDKEKDGTSASSSLSRHKTVDAGNIIAELSLGGKASPNPGYKSDLLGSLWITRFTPKGGSSVNQDSCNKSSGEGTDGMRLNSSPQNHLGSGNHEVVETRDQPARNPLQNCGTGTNTSFGFFKYKGQHDEQPVCKLSPSLPSQRIKISEAMASMFARRLDALKHINMMPSDITESAAHSAMTCFYCGIKGHRLQDCAEIPDTELEDLLRNVNSCNRTEELSCVCIKCFQPNHWAICCPNACLRVGHQTVCDTSLVNESGPSKMQLNARNEGGPKLTDSQDSHLQAASIPAHCEDNHPRTLKVLDLNQTLNEATCYEKTKLNMELFENDNASDSGEKNLKEAHVTPLFNFMNLQASDVPKGVVDAVKRLRLSRTDILKWMNSRMPLSHLDGFFLRLRLGKWEEGLGGTGYHVAFITGVKWASSIQKSKIPIPVNVGGIKCLVESQYVSNREFLEDEIMAWWSAILKGGDKIPSEEELKLKIKEKIMLGF